MWVRHRAGWEESGRAGRGHRPYRAARQTQGASRPARATRGGVGPLKAAAGREPRWTRLAAGRMGLSALKLSTASLNIKGAPLALRVAFGDSPSGCP
ncbi:hypothetical protein PSA01_40640 [Pseudonocardia saturnea]|uniref:Uncharacterized protein n=1 Tax=Pseudonocardia saturnea TaxID=33909 RepID=A0ABQ0S295_9PSEU|nr:hypothetical protein Pdca_69900 [Pseudonocardia autotrophica]GEC27035.1 hypothetical protein PSA01_40640 [Pseudonocardia saturnea]